MGTMNLKRCQETLQKRLTHLRKRVAASAKDLTFDKQEASALEYALKALSRVTTLPRTMGLAPADAHGHANTCDRAGRLRLVAYYYLDDGTCCHCGQPL